MKGICVTSLLRILVYMRYHYYLTIENSGVYEGYQCYLIIENSGVYEGYHYYLIIENPGVYVGYLTRCFLQRCHEHVQAFQSQSIVC